MSDGVTPPPHPSGETALLVIDMQNSYFEFPELAEQKDDLLARVNELLDVAHAANRPVVVVRTQHERDGSTWTLNMRDDEQGFAFPDTEQAQFLDGLRTGEHVEIVKTRDSAFFDTGLRDELERLGVAHLLICGVSTHSCVSQTAIDAFANDFHAGIARDCVASDNPELSDALLTFLEHEMRQPLLDRSDGIDLMRTGWPPEAQ